METTRLQEENATLKNKTYQLENKLSTDQARIRDLEARMKILDEERSSIIASKTNLQHAYMELQVTATSYSHYHILLMKIKYKFHN